MSHFEDCHFSPSLYIVYGHYIGDLGRNCAMAK